MLQKRISREDPLSSLFLRADYLSEISLDESSEFSRSSPSFVRRLFPRWSTERITVSFHWESMSTSSLLPFSSRSHWSTSNIHSINISLLDRIKINSMDQWVKIYRWWQENLKFHFSASNSTGQSSTEASSSSQRRISLMKIRRTNRRARISCDEFRKTGSTSVDRRRSRVSQPIVKCPVAVDCPRFVRGESRLSSWFVESIENSSIVRVLARGDKRREWSRNEQDEWKVSLEERRPNDDRNLVDPLFVESTNELRPFFSFVISFLFFFFCLRFEIWRDRWTTNKRRSSSLSTHNREHQLWSSMISVEFRQFLPSAATKDTAQFVVDASFLVAVDSFSWAQGWQVEHRCFLVEQRSTEICQQEFYSSKSN